MFKHYPVLFVFIAAIFTTILPPHIVYSGEFDAAVWVDRLIKQTDAMIDEGDMSSVDVSARVSDMMQILGYYNIEVDALRLEQRSRISPDEPDDSKLMGLAIGLSRGGFVDKAIYICEQIKMESSREYAFSFITYEQASLGNFEKALAIVPRLQTPERIKDTKIFICNSYVYAGRIDDAKRLAGDPPDSDILSEIDEAILFKHPPIDDPNYVDKMVRIRFRVPENTELFEKPDDWDALADYSRHFYTAKYLANKKDEVNFLKHANQALEILNRYPDRDWERLDLAALYFDNGKTDEARSLYSHVIAGFTSKVDDFPEVPIKMILTSVRRETPPAENIPHCFSATELRDMVNKYLDKAATWDMAAGLLALAIKDNNADWAEDIYQKYPLPEFKVKVAQVRTLQISFLNGSGPHLLEPKQCLNVNSYSSLPSVRLVYSLTSSSLVNSTRPSGSTA